MVFGLNAIAVMETNKMIQRIVLVLTFYLSLATKSMLAQAKVELTGQVKDNQSKNILEFCSVAVFNTHDSLITNSATDSKGFFTVNVDRGSYHLILYFIGYKNDTVVFHAAENKFLGIFKMEPTDRMLKEVNIKGNSNEKLLDREVQIVTDKLRAGAGSTKDVLDKLNGVHVDKYTNSIKVDSDDKVMILVDGVEKDQEYIKNLSPDRLKKIEIIRDPGGRYALEGYSAVINIILKKDYQGLEIFTSDRLMMETNPVDIKYSFVQNNFSTTLNYTYNKVNVYAKYSRNVNNFNLPSTDTKEYANGLIIASTPPSSQDPNAHMKQLFDNYTLGADFYINPKHTLSFESNLESQPLTGNITDGINAIAIKRNGSVLNNYSSQSHSVSEILNSYNSLFYVGKLNEKNTLNSNFTYSTYANTYSNLITESVPYQNLTNGTDKKNSTKFYLEYTHVFNSKTNLQIGYGNTWEKRNNTFTVQDSASKFDYSDFRNKLYSYFSWELNKKFGIKIGAAGESSAIESGSQSNSYLIFQPYADIRFKPWEVLDIKLKYRVESTYPNISQTNPFTSVIDQQSVKIGNPYLQPEVTHKVSLPILIAQLITIEPYYHYSGNFITTTGVLRKDSIFQYTYSNIGSYQKYGVQAHFTVPFGESIYFKTDFDIFKSSVAYSDKINNVNDWLMTNQLIYANQKHGTVAVIEYQHNLYKSINAQGYDMEGNDFWIIMLQQPFFKGKMNVMLLYFTPITLGVDFKQGSYMKTDSYTENKYGDISFLKNMIMIEISYRFNKGKSANKLEKDIERNNENNSKVL
jgi:hypothetical protein